MKRIVITGGSSGLGLWIRHHLPAVMYDFPEEDPDYPYIIDWSKETGVDLRNQHDIQQAAAELKGKTVDALINCAGINYIDWMPNITADKFDELMAVNARALMLTSQALLNNLSGGGTIVNIVSNASHMPMTHSIAYNASKGAAHIMTLQMARELKKTHNITVFGVSPNKLKGTGMSNYIDGRVCELRGWTPEQAAQYQKQSLPAGEETDPSACAEFIAFLLSSKTRHKFLNGCIIPYGA